MNTFYKLFITSIATVAAILLSSCQTTTPTDDIKPQIKTDESGHVITDIPLIAC